MYSQFQSPAVNRTRYSLVLWTLVGGFALFALWASLFHIDQSTRGVGEVIASSRVQIIQAVDGGVLDNLYVKEGDQVKQGQVLARLDQTRFTASVKELDARLAAFKAQAARLKAELTDAETIRFPEEVESFPELIRIQKALFEQSKRGFEQDLGILRNAVKLSEEELALLKKLSKSGDVSRSEVIRAEKALNDTRGKLHTRQNRYFEEARSELVKIEDNIAQNEQIRNQRIQQLNDSVFRAPVDGIVKNVRLTTHGGVLRSGEELMQIIPVDDQLIIETKIRPSDIADLRPGLPASIRFDAFDYTIYGAVEGTLSYVSADTLKERSSMGDLTYYRIHITTSGNPVITRTGKKLDILSGMTAQVDIRTGQRTVLDFLLKPLKKTLSDSFIER